MSAYQIRSDNLTTDFVTAERYSVEKGRVDFEDEDGDLVATFFNPVCVIKVEEADDDDDDEECYPGCGCDDEVFDGDFCEECCHTRNLSPFHDCCDVDFDEEECPCDICSDVVNGGCLVDEDFDDDDDDEEDDDDTYNCCYRTIGDEHADYCTVWDDDDYQGLMDALAEVKKPTCKCKAPCHSPGERKFCGCKGDCGAKKGPVSEEECTHCQFNPDELDSEYGCCMCNRRNV